MEDPVHGMLELHGDRDQPHTLSDLGPSRSRTPGVNHSDRAVPLRALSIRLLTAADWGSTHMLWCRPDAWAW